MAVNWPRIIAMVVYFIIIGLSEDEAVEAAAESFGVSVSDVFNHL